MTNKTGFGQNRTNVTIESNLVGKALLRRQRADDQNQKTDKLLTHTLFAVLKNELNHLLRFGVRKVMTV